MLTPEQDLTGDPRRFLGRGTERQPGCEPLEDHISSDVSDIVQVSKPDLVAGGVTVDLLKAAGRVRTKHEATKHKDLPREKGFLGHSIIVDEEAIHQSLCRQHSKALSESTNGSVKTSRSRVGGTQVVCLRIDGNNDQRETMFTQVWALLMEVKPYSCLIIFDGYRGYKS